MLVGGGSEMCYAGEAFASERRSAWRVTDAGQKGYRHQVCGPVGSAAV